jgi:hypothetical protein
VLFSLPIGREPFGDLLLTNNNKLIIFNRDSDNDVFISQFIYPTGGAPEVDIQLTQYTWNPPFGISLSLFFDNGNIFILDGDGVVSSISNTYPYTVTEYFNFGFDSVGTSQIQSCINVEFVPYTTQVTYYAYKLCDDTTGPQTYVYQTVPSLVTVLNNSMFNINENNCWSYYGSYTSIPQNSTDDIIVFEGNYFTSVSPTQYNNCTQCIQSTCVPPPNLINISLKYSYSIDGGPFTSFQNGPETVVCDTVYYLFEGLFNNTIGNFNFGGVSRYVVSLEIGSYVYTNQTTCDCGASNGFYYITSDKVVILISNCIIVNIWPCDYNAGTSPSNPNGTGGSGGSGSGAGGSSPTSDCQCTAVKTISGFQSTAFYTDCDGNPAQITVPANTGIPSTSTACFCRQAGTEVTGPVILEACQTIQGGSSGSSNITNNCLDQISCN